MVSILDGVAIISKSLQSTPGSKLILCQVPRDSANTHPIVVAT